MAVRSAPGAELRRPGERLEQRPVEQPLVDRPDEAGRAVVLLLQHAPRRKPERARDRRAGTRVGRQVVRLQVANDLQAVLQPPQESVRVGERRGVGLGDVALGGERVQRRKGVRAPQTGVAPAVHDLEQLDGELDVANAAAAALDLGELLAALADVLLEPHLRPAHVVDRGGLEMRRIHEGLDPGDERARRASRRPRRRAP